MNSFFVLEYNYSPAYPSMRVDDEIRTSPQYMVNSAVLNFEEKIFVKLCDFFGVIDLIL